VTSYNPLRTLRPYRYEIELGQGAFGTALILRTSGSDIAGMHAFAAQLNIETENAQPQFGLDYAYGRLPFTLGMSVFRNASPRGGYRIGESEPRVIERQIGATTGVTYGLPGDYESQVMALSYSVVRFEQDLPVGTRPDPWAAVPIDPHQGWLGLIRLGYSYSNASSTGDAISLERGFTLNASGDFADHAWGSENTLTAIVAGVAGYAPMPWGNHHVMALALQGGAAVGDYPRRGYFSTGGFVDQPVFDAFRSGIRQSSFVLRGYEPGQFVGTQYNLLNTEYRFPILYADRGISTLPFFLRTLSGNVFMDWGGAYNQMDLDDPLASYHMGVGAELWIDLVLGYYASANLRLGVAKGLDDEAPSGFQTYFVASSAF
jgi:hypothetical protein